jgi:hypothetical protein
MARAVILSARRHPGGSALAILELMSVIARKAAGPAREQCMALNACSRMSAPHSASVLLLLKIRARSSALAAAGYVTAALSRFTLA